MHGDFLEIPLTRRSQVAPMCGYHAVSRSVCLARIDAGVVFVFRVQDLQLAHPGIGRVSTSGVPNRQTIVAGWRQLELKASLKIAILV